MSDKPSATEMALHMDRVSNASDANRVTNEFLQTVHGMSMNESLTFARQVRAAHHTGQGEDIAITTDLTHAHVIFSNPYTQAVRVALPDGKPEATDGGDNSLAARLRRLSGNTNLNSNGEQTLQIPPLNGFEARPQEQIKSVAHPEYVDHGAPIDRYLDSIRPGWNEESNGGKPRNGVPLIGENEVGTPKPPSIMPDGSSPQVGHVSNNDRPFVLHGHTGNVRTHIEMPGPNEVLMQRPSFKIGDPNELVPVKPSSKLPYGISERR